MPDVAPHIFIVGECRNRPNVLGFQAIADRLPGQLSEDRHMELVSLVTESTDAAFGWRRDFCSGWWAKAFWNPGSAWMNLMRATLARAACGMSSRFASPRMIFRSKDFRAESWPGLKNLWFSGFLATSSRAEQPQQQTGCASHSASNAALARLFSHAFRIASDRAVAGRCSVISDCSVSIYHCKLWTYLGARLPLCVWSRGAACRRRSWCTRNVFGAPRGHHLKRSPTPLCRASSRRLRAPLPSVEGRSVFGARASPGLREGCLGDERSRRSPSRLQFSMPVGLGPAPSNLGPGRNIGGAPSAQNAAQSRKYAPLLDLAAYRDGIGGPTGFSSRGRRTPRHVPGCRLTFGRLWRRPAIWSDTSLWPRAGFPVLSRPIPRPEIPAGSLRSTEPSETTGQAKFFRGYAAVDRKSTRLNSSHLGTSYA